MEANQEILKYTLSLNLKKLRTLNDLSLKDLSDLTGLSTSYLNEIEKGKKYPKIDKLVPLAFKLGVDLDKMVNPSNEEGQIFLLNFLKSKFFQDFPFEIFGLSKLDFFELMSVNPEKFSSLLKAIFSMASNFQVETEDFYKMALRSYQESNKNFFPEIETKANLFLEDLKTDEVKISELEEILKNRFRYKIDYQLLAKNKNLKELGSVFKKGKEKILFINRILHPTQILFLLGKEIGYCELQLNRGESQSSSFEHHLNEFKASYFSGCLLIPKKLIVEDLEHLFQRNKFPDKEFIKLMKKYKTNAEVLLNRVIQVLSGYFKIDNLFFLRLKSSPDGNTKKLKINKELHFSKLHFAHGIGLPEHYCRRWITVTILEELEKLPKNTPIIRAQKSVMANNGERFFCVAIARKSSLKENTYSCLTVGIPIDKVSEKKIKFLNDPKISEKVVGKTCERCNLSDCDERAYPATIAERIKKKELIKSEINSLLTDNDF